MLHFMHPCYLVPIRWTFFISEPDKVHHQSTVAAVSTSWDKPVCTHDTLWRHCYSTICKKKYLTNGHILPTYFELEFPQLHLVKISCELIIIWLNYERKKRTPFYETLCIYRCSFTNHSNDNADVIHNEIYYSYSSRVPAGFFVKKIPRLFQSWNDSFPDLIETITLLHNCQKRYTIS